MTGRELREVRSALGLSVGDFASLLGLSPRTVYRWEAPGRLSRRATLDGLKTSIVGAMQHAIGLEQDLDVFGAGVRDALRISGPARALHRVFVTTFGTAA